MSVADLAIVAALSFGWGTLSARLERSDVTAPIIFVLAGLLLTHGLLALEELGSPAAGDAVAVITLTVLLSVVVHGVTAEPLAARYARLLAGRTADQAGAQVPDMPARRLTRHNSPPQGDTHGRERR